MIILITIVLALIGIFLIITSTLSFFFQGLPGSGNDTLSIVIIFIIGLCFLGGAFWSNSSLASDLGYEQAENLGYKQGQIDAANGIQKYHLTTRPKVWEKKETP